MPTDLLSASETVRDRTPDPSLVEEPRDAPESPLAKVATAAFPDLPGAKAAFLDKRAAIPEAIGERQAAVAPKIEATREAMAQPAPEVPQILQLRPAPSGQIREFLAPVSGEPPEASVSKMVAALGLFAQMGGSIARGHARSGMAALTGALQGWQLGDHERAEREFRAWHADTQKAVTEHRSTLDHYEELLKARDKTIEERWRDVQMAAFEHGDRVLAAQADADTSEKFLHILEKEHESNRRAAEAAASLAESRRINDSRIAHQRRQEEKWAQEHKDAQSSFTPETLQRLASRYRAGEPIRDLVRGFGKVATNAMIQIQNIAEQQALAEGDTPGAIRLRKANLDANRGALAKLTRDESDFNSFLSSFEKQLANTRRIVEAAKTSGSPIWNKPALWYRAAVDGDPAAKNLMAQMEILANEMARVTLRTRGTAEGTRQHHRDLLNGSMTLEQFDSLAQEVMTMDAQAARDGFAAQKRVLQGDIGGLSAPPVVAPVGPEGAPQRVRAAEYNGVRKMVPADTDLSKFPGAKWIN